MELEFNRQIISLQNEISILKSSLNPVYLLLQEIQEIKKKHHISQANTLSSVALLSMDIKEDLLKELSLIRIHADEKLNELKQENKKLRKLNLEKDHKIF